MSLKLLDRLSKTIGFRLALAYSAIFVLSSLVLFVTAYFFLSYSIEHRDRENIVSEFYELAIQHQKGGIESLSEEVAFEKQVSGKNPFFVRLVGPRNNTLFLNMPDEFTRADLREIESRGIRDSERWQNVTIKNDRDMLEVYSKSLPDGSYLQVGKSMVNRRELLERFRRIVASIMLPVIIIGLTGGGVLAYHALRPIRHLIETTSSIIKTGKIDARVPTAQRGDELDELSTLFNTMLEKIETLIRRMKEGLDDVAHDLRTPLMRMRVMAETALQSDDDIDGLKCALSNCIEESERILTMSKTIMDISEAETGAMNLSLEVLNIANLIEEVVSLYRYIAEDKDITIYMAVPRDLYLSADRNRLQQAIANLVDNAVKYTQSGGRVDIEAFKGQQEIVILVKDTGIGIAFEEIQRIWDRLYRGDKSRSQRGLGLGLSLVKAIVQAHRGHVDASSELGVGSIFAIHIPKNL